MQQKFRQIEKKRKQLVNTELLFVRHVVNVFSRYIFYQIVFIVRNYNF